jgi:hypothetical protein
VARAKPFRVALSRTTRYFRPMPRKPIAPPIGQATLTPAKALEMLTTQMDRAAKLPLGDESATTTWVSQTKHWVGQSFGENSSKAHEFSAAGPVTYNMNNPSVYWRDVLSDKVDVLRAFVGVLTDTVALGEPQAFAQSAAPATTASKKVFVVHGHDDGAKEAVARFIERLDLQPIILQEQANGGRTLIEKFEAHSDVAFAVVLLTPDDRGGTAAAKYEDQKPRARAERDPGTRLLRGALGTWQGMPIVRGRHREAV